MIPVLVIGACSVYFSRYQLQNDYSDLTRADGARLKSTLFDITTSMFTLSENIIQSYSYMQLLSTSDMVSQEAAWTQLTDYMEDCRLHNASLNSICLYTNNPAVRSGKYIVLTETFTDAPWYDEALDHKRQLWKTIPEADHFGNVTPYLTLVRKMGLPSPSFQAYLVIRICPNYIKSRLKNNEFQIFCCVNNSPAFYASTPALAQEPMYFPDDPKHLTPHYTYNGVSSRAGEKMLTNICAFQPYRTEDTIYISVSSPQAIRRLHNVTLANFLMLFIAVCFPTVIVSVFSSRFSTRIAVLKDAMHRASQGNYDILETFSGDDELTETFRHLKETVQRVQETQKQYYEGEITRERLINQQQQMEFKMLASQINPHFLYNTLETIRMQALASGARDVASSVKLLGDTMHYVLENTGMASATLDKELHYTLSYLKIQQLRFGSRLRYDLDVDDTLEPAAIKILPLVIQPLVENAVIHGLAPKAEGGHVLVQVSCQDFRPQEPAGDRADLPPEFPAETSGEGQNSGCIGMPSSALPPAEASGKGQDPCPTRLLCIRIQDNGSGMTPDALTALKKRMYTGTMDGHTESIGLANIHQRLCLLYGNAYSIRIDSSPQKGTDITLTFPIERI